jgi:seryl-tRNA synthetase
MADLLCADDPFGFRTVGPRVGYGDVEQELANRGWIKELATGTIAMSGEFVRLVKWAEQRFTRIARGLDAEEMLLPDVMSPHCLEASNYLNSFPHHAMFARRAADTHPEAEKDVRGLMLTPTVCLNIFEALGGSRLMLGETRILFSTKRCFREEVTGGAARLRNFTMLEIVFCGPPPDVRRLRADLAQKTAEVLLEADLQGEIQSASDPFFLGPEGNHRRLIENRFGLKYELLLAGPRGPVAASSYNLHLGFFARRFQIRTVDDSELWSGCVGFGLERWALAFCAQHGLDPRHWPSSIRQSLDR